jgi:hypothetical protein
MNKISFNTRRMYTSNGQEIDAIQLDDGQVLFVDHSRGIDGLLECELTQAAVMREYDASRYNDIVLSPDVINLRNLVHELTAAHWAKYTPPANEYAVIDLGKQTAVYESLCKQALKLKGETNSRRVQYLLDQAADNAGLTVCIEKAAPVEQWHSVFVATLESLLCTNKEPAAVINWFQRRNITTFNA